MSKHREIRWLYDQLPELTTHGLLTEAQAEALRKHYGPLEDHHSPNLASIIIGVLGVLLVGGGIILIIAYNWDYLSRGWRTVISFAPLLLAQGFYTYMFFRRPNSTAWVEGASTFLFLMIGASIALISQTYHIEGRLADYLLSWALLSIPLMYLLNASLPAILYLIGIAWWVSNREGNEGVYYWGLLAAAIPHLVINLRPERSPIRRHLLGWALVLPFFFAWWWVIEPEITAYSFIGTALVLSNLYLLGPLVYSADDHFFIRPPFSTSAVIGVFIFLLVLTFRLNLEPVSFDQLINGDRLEPWAARLNLLVLVLLFLAYFRLFLSRFSARYPIGHAIWFFPFVVLAYLFLNAGAAQTFALVIANLYSFALGLTFLISGLRTQHLGRVNTGLLFILVLAAVRFFDTNWSYIIKGVAFVLLGMGFLIANALLARRLKTKT